MTRQTTAAGAAATVDLDSGLFLYGLVPGDVEMVDPSAHGLGDPAGPVTVIRHRDVAALVSEVPRDVRLGRPDDLVGYQELLDGIAGAAGVPVLPVRFGTVLSSREAVGELLAARHDTYRAALAELDGRVEYLVRARYVGEALLSRVVADDPGIAALRDRLRGQPAGAAVDLRIRLGEQVHRAVEAHRGADTERLVRALAPYALAHSTQPPRHEQEAGRVAFLVERSRGEGFEEAVTALADEWRAWASVRLVGPAAAWDFVPGLRGGR